MKPLKPKSKFKFSTKDWILIASVALLFIVVILAFYLLDTPSETIPDPDAPAAITLNVSDAELAVDDTLTLKATTASEEDDNNVKWKTSDDDIVTVENGLVTPKALGSATVTAYLSSNLSASCTITVHTSLNDFVFTLNDDNSSYSLTSYKQNDKKVIVPTNYKNLPITSIASGAFSEKSYLESVTLGKKVETLSANCFTKCTSLTTVIIPSSITTVAENAFNECVKFKYNVEDGGNIQYLGNPENPYLVLVKPTDYSISKCTVAPSTQIICANAFSGCSQLEEIILTDNISYIGRNAFFGCDELEYTKYENGYYLGTENNPHFAIAMVEEYATYLFIHNNTKIIAQETLNNSPELKTLSIGDGITNISDYAFTDRKNSSFITTNLETVVLGNGVNSIGSFAFASQKNLKSVTFGSGLTKIGTGAFFCCQSLASVVIPSNVKNIQSGAFFDCYNISNLFISSGVTSIGVQTFYNCTGLTSLYIPSSVTKIGEAAFGNCYNLESLRIAANDKEKANTVIDKLAFDNAFNLVEADLTAVKAVGPYAFNNASKLNSLRFGNSLEKIESCAFENCYSLTDLVLPDSLKTISDKSFNNCYGILTLRLGKDLESVNKSAFQTSNKILSIANYSEFNIVSTGDANDDTLVIPAQKVYTKNQPKTVYDKVNDYLFYTDDKGNKDASDDVYYLVGYVGNNKTPTLPADFNGNSYAIYDYAFCGNDVIVKVNIPNDIAVGKKAFAECHNLVSINYNLTLDADVYENSYKVTDSATIEVNGFEFSVSIEENTLKENYTLINYLGNESNLTLPAPSTVKSSLTEYKISNYAFYNEPSIKTVVIPDGVTSIGKNAFYKCTALESVTLPSTTLKTIEEAAFSHCFELKSIVLPDTVTEIKNDTFHSCYELSDVQVGSVTDIGDRAFYQCFGLKEIILPSTLQKLGGYAFYNCYALKSITIPNGITVIKERTFAFCYQLKEVNLPESLEKIEIYAFNECKKLESIKLPKNFNSINPYSFYTCELLKEIKVDSENLVFADKDGVLFNKDFTTLYYYPAAKTEKSYVVPESVTLIDYVAFYDNEYLENLTLPSGLKDIKGSAIKFSSNLKYNEFDNGLYLGSTDNPYMVLIKAKNTNITTCQIHENTKIIYFQAFSSCSKLKEITIPNSVYQIQGLVFSNCPDLIDITFANKQGWSVSKNNGTPEEINADKLSDSKTATSTMLGKIDYDWVRQDS